KFSDHNDLIELCNEIYADNPIQRAVIDEFRLEYSCDKAVWWYTRDSCFYRMLNKACRIEDFGMLIMFRLFIKDIYKQLRQEHACQSFDSIFHVYRGQIISAVELKHLNAAVGQYISINSFLSASRNRIVAEMFAGINSSISSTEQAILFDIEVDPHLESLKPFAGISHLSHFGMGEEEVIFMLGTIFRIMNVKRTEEQGIWIIKLRLCDENEHDLKDVYKYMKENIMDKEMNRSSPGMLLIQMGLFNKAEIFYKRLMNTLLPNDLLLANCFEGLGIIATEKGDNLLAIDYYRKEGEILSQTYPSDHLCFAFAYGNLATVCCKSDLYDTAIEHYNRALSIFIKYFGKNHSDVIRTYNNLGNVYLGKKDYDKAMFNYKKSLELRESILPNDHPELATTYLNIATIHDGLEEYDSELLYQEKALKIYLKSLPKNHPNVGLLYKNIAATYKNRNQFELALENYLKANEIYRHVYTALDPNHPKLIDINHTIENLKSKLVN
ncbi:unnamed protein product, partial [Didymodactylos carnosus]